ncbi:hypothetical protein ABZ934_30780 [Streptomyces sp. NPDC046557]|uniref:hypothetical protein n=1 Tax=Streptomyces sp. NPDC046557 TaxID=3155372 RepID=UPI0033E9CD15
MRDPMVLAVSSLILAGAASFVFAAPPTVEAVNRLAGIQNVATPVDYAAVTVFSCASIVLIITWRGGAVAERRSIRTYVAGYAAVIATLIILFALGDAPVERLRDFDTYYANTPYVRKMIALYLVGHMVAAAILCTMCRKRASEVRGRLRAGLVVLLAGFTLNWLFVCVKLTGVAARLLRALSTPPFPRQAPAPESSH